MAVIIQNVSSHSSPFGEHEYEVRINTKVVATFTHKREEGLTVCLRKAMEAVERTKWEETQRAIEAAAATEGWPR